MGDESLEGGESEVVGEGGVAEELVPECWSIVSVLLA